MRTIWIGWPGIFVESEVQQDQIRRILAEYNCVPVFHTNDVVNSYLEFHEKVIRPLFHNFKGMDEREDTTLWPQWSHYLDFNSAYMDSINAVHESNKDMIWIHDTYLLLLPKLVRRQYTNARIGFSMHSPFPSSDIYRMFEHRKDILKSLLCSDLIGFHIFEYARHFYTACQRLLGLNHEFKQGGQLVIEYFGRSV